MPLDAARGRVLARDVVAPIDLPPFDNSAVDGYAVRHADLEPSGETRLAIVDRVTAGRAAARALAAGEAIRIFTGAPMPAGADTVFMQEDCRVDGDAVVVPPGLKRGANRRLAGEDVRAGAVMLPAGRRLDRAARRARRRGRPAPRLTVRRRVRVAVFSTGDEIVEPGAPRPARRALRRQPLSARRADRAARRRRRPISASCPTTRTGSPRAIAAAAAGHDLVLTSGGVSTGEADHVRAAVESDRPAGVLARRHQAGPAGRDGRDPGQRSRRRRGLRRAAGQSGRGVRDLRARGAAAAAAARRRRAGAADRAAGARGLRLSKRKGRREYVRVKLVRAADGGIEAVKHAQDGAGVITSLTETDGLVELAEDTTTVEPGATVGFLSYAALVGLTQRSRSDAHARRSRNATLGRLLDLTLSDRRRRRSRCTTAAMHDDDERCA